MAKRGASLVGAQLVACVEGPYAGMWWHAADWAARRQAAQRMTDNPHRPAAADAVLDYVLVRDAVEHPREVGVVGQLAAYRPR